MKKLLFVIIILPFLFIGCQKDSVDSLFEGLPEERMEKRLQELRSKLLDSPNGWKAQLNTGTATSKKAFNFYIDFDDASNYKILSDRIISRANDWQNSTYRVIWSMNASLVFDTFSYITELQEPSSIYGGTAPHGYRSDVEFEYVRSSADSIILIGKKYQHKLLLTKVSKEESEGLEGKLFKSKIESVNKYFADNRNMYFEIGNNGVKYGINIDRLERAIHLIWIEDGKVQSSTSSFAYSLDGVDIFEPIDFKGEYLSKLKINGGSGYAIVNGQSYEIKNNSSAVVPITSLFGANAAFNSIQIIGSALPQGITSQFNTLWSNQLSNYTANGVSMVSCIFKLNNSNTASLMMRFNSGGTVYVAQADYTYTYKDGVLKLSAPTSTNGNYNNGWIIAAIKNYFSGAEFKVDFALSSNPDIVNIGALYKTNDPTSFFYGKLATN